MILDATQGGWQAGLNLQLASTLLVAAGAIIFLAYLFITERFMQAFTYLFIGLLFASFLKLLTLV